MYRVQCIIDTDLEVALRKVVEQAAEITPKQRTQEDLTSQEKNELSCIALRNRPGELDEWLKEHNLMPIPRKPRSLNALIIGLLNQYYRYTQEELAEMMDNSGVRPAGRPPL